MKLSKRDIGLLAGALGVIVAAMVYALLFVPSQDKIAALKSELASLEETEDDLLELAEKKGFYEGETVRMTEENNQILAEFPADIKPETEIMYAVELEDKVDVKFSSLNYGVAMPLMGNGDVEVDTEVQNSGEMQAYCVPMSMAYQSSYKGLKDTIKYTNNHQNRMVIDSISAAYDGTTGLVTGGMTLNMYYVTGTEKVYEEPYVPHMNMGVSNIFGSIE